MGHFSAQGLEEPLGYSGGLSSSAPLRFFFFEKYIVYDRLCLVLPSNGGK